ncbi:MAG TPA: hypothetical protein VF698_15845 [Thermoanaerobaculia bacterium]|jgi:hypothetical protein
MIAARGLVLVSSLLALPLLAAGTVDGTFTANGKKVKLTHAYAAPRANPFDKKKTDVVLLVTDREMPPEAVHDDFALMRAQEGANGFTVQITADRSIVSGQVFSPNFKKMNQFSGVGMQKLELTAMTADRIAGKVSVPKEDFFDNLYEYSVTFDVPVTAKPKPAALKGTPVAAGGGEPGAAYEKYRKAMKSGDLAALRKSLAAERVAQLDKPEFKEMLPMIQTMLPKTVKIVSGAIDGDTATLKAEAKDSDNEWTYGTITMVKEAGVWKLQKESWRNRAE